MGIKNQVLQSPGKSVSIFRTESDKFFTLCEPIHLIYETYKAKPSLSGKFMKEDH